MYQIINAFAQPNHAYANWQVLEDAGSLTGEVLNEYRDIWFEVKHSALLDNQGLQYSTFAQDVGLGETLSDYFTRIGEQALPTTQTIPYLRIGRLIYEEVTRARFTVNVVNEFTTQTHERYDDNQWVKLTREGLDTKKAYEHFLVSVNGLLHPTDYNTEALFVQHAVKSSLISERAEIGIYSFEQLGKLSFVPVTEAMVVETEYALKDRTILKVDADLTTVTPMISLGGYLHVLDPKTFRTVGEGLLQIDWQSVPLIKRYYESMGLIDLSSLTLDHHTDNDELINIAQLYSDEVLMQYLTLPQTFLIFIDTALLSKEMLAIEPGPTNHRYYGYKDNRFPMVSPTGKLLEYWKILEHGVYSYFTPPASRLNYLYEYSDPRDLVNIDPTLIGAFPGAPESKGNSLFINLYTHELKHMVLQR